MSLFAYDFMQRALIGVLITGLAAPSLGIYLVQRRMALIGDGIGHIALTGVGLGLLTSRSPVITAVVVSALGAVAVELIRERGKASGDIALALLFYGGISGGVFLVTLSSGRTNANLMAYLFGSPLTTSPVDLLVMVVLGAVVLAVTLLLRPWLFAVCQDEEYARVAGLPVRALNLLLAVTTAVTVTVAMRAVGLLLVSALMVVPVAAAQLVTRGFRTTMHVAMLLGVLASGLGITLAAQYDTAPGATIVLVAIGIFAALATVSAIRRGSRRRTLPCPDPLARSPKQGRAAGRRARCLAATVGLDEHPAAGQRPVRSGRGAAARAGGAGPDRDRDRTGRRPTVRARARRGDRGGPAAGLAAPPRPARGRGRTGGTARPRDRLLADRRAHRTHRGRRHQPRPRTAVVLGLAPRGRSRDDNRRLFPRSRAGKHDGVVKAIRGPARGRPSAGRDRPAHRGLGRRLDLGRDQGVFDRAQARGPGPADRGSRRGHVRGALRRG
jgi:zinc transport system permease protein